MSGGGPLRVPEDGDVRSLGQALAHPQAADGGKRVPAHGRGVFGLGPPVPPGPTPGPGLPVIPWSLAGLGPWQA